MQKYILTRDYAWFKEWDILERYVWAYPYYHKNQNSYDRWSIHEDIIKAMRWIFKPVKEVSEVAEAAYAQYLALGENLIRDGEALDLTDKQREAAKKNIFIKAFEDNAPLVKTNYLKISTLIVA